MFNQSSTLKVIFSLLMLALTSSVWAASEESSGHSSLRVILVNVSSYRNYRETRNQLKQIEGVEKIQVLSESPNLITLGMEFNSTPASFIEKCTTSLGEQYTIKQKNLPSGVVEINLAKK